MCAFSGLSLKKIISIVIAFTKRFKKNHDEPKNSLESPWRGKTHLVCSKINLFPQRRQGNGLSPKCSDPLWLSNSFRDLNLAAQRTQGCIFSSQGSMMLVLLLTAGWQVLHCEPLTTHGAGWGLLIITWLLCTHEVWALRWLLRLVEDEIVLEHMGHSLQAPFGNRAAA